MEFDIFQPIKASANNVEVQETALKAEKSEKAEDGKRYSRVDYRSVGAKRKNRGGTPCFYVDGWFSHEKFIVSKNAS